LARSSLKISPRFSLKSSALFALLAIFSQAYINPCALAETPPQALIPPAVINHELPPALTERLTIEQVKVFGQATKTHWQLLSPGPQKTYLVIIGKNDDILAGLYNFIETTKIKSGHFTAIGAVGAAALGFYRPEDHTYTVTKVAKQAEVVSLAGNIGSKNGKTAVHTHGVISLEDGTCIGGHIFYATAWLTVEIVVTECPDAAIREHDQESGLWLFKPDSSAK